MKLHDKIFCKSIGVYSNQLTKRKAYIIEGINDENVRVKNDESKLKWYSKYYFNLENPSEITVIKIDDAIKNSLSDCVEVTIEFENGDRYWTTFSTPAHLLELLNNQKFLSLKYVIIVKELNEKMIKEIILDMDNQNELLDKCQKY